MTKSGHSKRIIWLLSMFILLLGSAPAWATLGGSLDSVETDRKAFSAAKRGSTAYSNYAVHEISSASNTIREYVSQSGVVFAVAWQGLVPPDIEQLLGTYYNDYKAALQGTPRNKGSRRQKVTASGVTVERWGHMRNLQGRAYAPALMPSGVTLDDIR